MNIDEENSGTKLNYLPSVGDSVEFWNNNTYQRKASNIVGDPQVLILDTTFLSEGLNLLGIDMVFGLSDFQTMESLIQAYGRADRMCTSRYFRTEHTRNELLMTQYVFSGDPFVDLWKQNKEEPVENIHGIPF
jgi:superfamily II DNA or RNA helicase